MQNKDIAKLKILQSYTANFPLLESVGKIIKQPIAIVAEDREQGLSVVKQLSRKPVIIDSTWSVKDVEEAVTTTTSEAVVWVRPEQKYKSVRSLEIEELIFNAAFLNRIRNKDASVSIFILENRFVETALKGKVFEVSLSISGNENRFTRENIVPRKESVIIALNEMLQQEDLHPLEAAAIFIRYCSKVDCVDIAEEMMKEAIESYDNEGISSIVIEEITRFIKNKHLIVHTMKSLRDTEINNLQNIVILDDDRILINEGVFKAAVSNLTDEISISVIKRQLEAEHVLLPSQDGFTRKKVVYTRNCKYRIHVIILDISKYPDIKSLKY